MPCLLVDLPEEPELPSRRDHTNINAQLKIEQKKKIIMLTTSFGLTPVPTIDQKLVCATVGSRS